MTLRMAALVFTLGLTESLYLAGEALGGKYAVFGDMNWKLWGDGIDFMFRADLLQRAFSCLLLSRPCVDVVTFIWILVLIYKAEYWKDAGVIICRWGRVHTLCNLSAWAHETAMFYFFKKTFCPAVKLRYCILRVHSKPWRVCVLGFWHGVFISGDKRHLTLLIKFGAGKWLVQSHTLCT